MNTVPFRISLSSGSLYHVPLNRFFALASQLELDGVELVIGPECALRGAPTVSAIAAKHGVRILSLHPPILPLPGWTRLAALTDLLARWAFELSAQVVTVHTPRLASLDTEAGTRYLNLVGNLANRLRASGSQLALENRARYSRTSGIECLDQPSDLLALAQAWQAGITFDTAHAGTMCSDILAAYAILSPGLVNIHLSDLTGPGRWPTPIWMETVLQHHQIPGSGTLPLRALVEKLFADQYAGLVTLELSPLALGLWSTARAKASLDRCVGFLRGDLV